MGLSEKEKKEWYKKISNDGFIALGNTKVASGYELKPTIRKGEQVIPMELKISSKMKDESKPEFFRNLTLKSYEMKEKLDNCNSVEEIKKVLCEYNIRDAYGRTADEE